MKQYDIAAYIWPSYTGKEPRSRIFWPEGIGEWETVMRAMPRFEGHRWPRKPLLGYRDEAEQATMEEQIDLARRHGVNVFIYDWYWYDRRPFLEQCLNEGFLGASNNETMSFYLMWANHDANYLWDRRGASKSYATTPIWHGFADREQFEALSDRLIRDYFSRSNYYCIDDKPVFAIYDLPNLLATFGSVEQTAEAMRAFDEKAKRAGHAGVHFQLIYWGNAFVFQGTVQHIDDCVRNLPFSSMTHYQYVHFTDVTKPAAAIRADAVRAWHENESKFGIPFYPHVSVGWDNNPRHEGADSYVFWQSEAEFEDALRMAKEYADQTGRPLITINAWNEWTEGSYLLPDDLMGDAYLRAIRRVFGEA